MKNKSDAKRLITPDGLNIYYWVSWRKDFKKRFFVLHSDITLNHSSLQGLESMLNNLGFPTITFDVRGVGFSDAPKDRDYYHLENYSNDLEAIIINEGIENTIILGHGFGFMPVVGYASKEDNNMVNDLQRFSAIIGVCCSYNFQETRLRSFHPKALIIKALEAKHIAYLTHFSIAGYRLLKDGFKHGRYAKPYNNQSLVVYKSYLNVILSTFKAPLQRLGLFVDIKKQAMSWDITDQLRYLKTNLLLVHGLKDTLVRPTTGYEIGKITNAECKVTTCNGDHAIPITHPELVIDIIKKNYDFLTSLNR